MQITITPDNLPKPLYSATATGQVIDAFAMLAGLSEWEQAFQDSFEYLDQVIDQTFNELDMESIFIEELNNKTTLTPKGHKCNLLNGACSALHFAEQFAEDLENFTDKQKELSHECLGDYSSCVPAISTALQQAYDWSHESMYDEYLRGDRSSMGVLGYIRKELKADNIDYDQKTDVLTITWNEQDDLVEWLGLDNEEKYTKKELMELFFDVCVELVSSIQAKKKAEREKLKAEDARVKAYQTEQKQKADADRKAKLLAMTK